MKHLFIIPVLMTFVSCSSTPKLQSPVTLADAILTLPSNAVSGMSETGRRICIESKSGAYDESSRKLHHFSDGPDGPDADSMLYLRLFEDKDGQTIAASHSARPYADGSDPSASDTSVFRLQDGEWDDITDTVFPAEVSREWWFDFADESDRIPCGPYVEFSRSDGRGMAYRFGENAGHLVWDSGAFRFIPSAS